MELDSLKQNACWSNMNTYKIHDRRGGIFLYVNVQTFLITARTSSVNNYIATILDFPISESCSMNSDSCLESAEAIFEDLEVLSCPDFCDNIYQNV